MNRLILLILLIPIIAMHNGCTKDAPAIKGSGKADDPWLVNTSEILYMGYDRDRIQSIDNPIFLPIHSIDLEDDELVYSVNYNGTTKVYPVSVLGIHEIVNDKIDDHYYAITYCPLTGSGIAWNRNINGEITEFGVSGMLYKENLIPYDRNTLSNWSQMKGMCVNGEMIGYEAEQVTLISSTFGMIRRAYPDAMVLNHEACGEGICKDLKSGNDFGEPDETVKLPSGSSHFGIAKEENLLLFDMDLFNDSIETYNAVFRGQRFLVIGHSNNQYFAAFMYNESISGDYYEPIQNSMPMVMRDKLGNYYDLFGNITVGPEKGNRLLSPNAYFAHNFAWQALFQGIEIYNE